MAKHTFETTHEVEEKWLKYEKNSDACFTKMVNNAITYYLIKKSKKNTN